MHMVVDLLYAYGSGFVINVMDKIWYRNPTKSEVIGRCGGDEKTNDHAEPTKVECLKKI